MSFLIQRKMVKLLLSHFANPHALTCNFNLPRDLAQDQTIKEDLMNAEETFLGFLAVLNLVIWL